MTGNGRQPSIPEITTILPQSTNKMRNMKGEHIMSTMKDYFDEQISYTAKPEEGIIQEIQGYIPRPGQIHFLTTIISVENYYSSIRMMHEEVNEMFEFASEEFAKGAKCVEFDEPHRRIGKKIVIKPETKKEDVISAWKKLYGLERFERLLEEKGLTIEEAELKERKRNELWLKVSDMWLELSLEERCDKFGIDMGEAAY